jgi:hypothetical protein
MNGGDWQPFAEAELFDHARSVAGCWDELRPKLPADRRWFAGSWPTDELGLLVHTPCEVFAILSAGSGRVSATAQRLADGTAFQGVAEGPARLIRTLAAEWDACAAGTLVLGANDSEVGPWMLLDGNHRATALELRRLRGAEQAAVAIPVVLALSARPLRPW